MSFLCQNIISETRISNDGIIYFSSFFISAILILIFYYFIAPPLISYLSVKNLNSISNEFNNLYTNLCNTYKENLKKMQYILLLREVLEALSIFCLVSIIYNIDYPVILLIVIIILYIVVFFLTKNISTKYSDYYKNNVIKTLLESFNENLEYSPRINNKDSLYKLYENSNFPTQYFTSFSADDFIYGQIDNNYIEMFNLLIERNNTRRDMHTVFSGLFLVEKCNIHIPENVQILKYEIPKISNVPTDSTNFNKYFRLYCNDNILAMSIFTPDILEFMSNFYEKYNINFEISIYQDSINFKF